MGKIAFVFSGQGAQYPGMGSSLYNVSPKAREVFDLAERLRPGTIDQCFSGAKEELMVTKNTQPCLYCTDLAAACALREAGVRADMAAGFSLGEISALTFSGAFTPETGFELVCRRGELMQAAAEKFDSAMVAVVKLPNEKVEELCAQFSDVYPVNYNCPGQLVAAGLKSRIEDFKAAVKEAGGRALPLAVSGGFHSPFMASAAQGLRKALESVDMKAPEIPLYANRTAEPYSGDLKALTAAQVENPVRWQETVENMIAAGADIFIECGPGRTLCGLIGKISKNVLALHVEDGDTLKETLEAVKANA